MGYNTRYSLQVEGTKTIECPQCGGRGAIEASLDELVVEAVKQRTGGYDPFDDSNKWYEHEEDMIEVSKQFPDVPIVLEGDGETQGDVWRKEFLNGKMRVARADLVLGEFSNWS